jgi:hypothetical protein
MGKTRKRNYGAIVIAGIAVGVGIFTVLNQPQDVQACGTTEGAIVGPPSVNAQTINSAFVKQPGTPAELRDMSTANYIVAQSNQFQIDDAFAMADWQHEGSYGTSGVAAQDRNIGNITISIPFNPNPPNRPVIGYTPAGDPIYELLPSDYTNYVDKEHAGTPIGFIYISSSGLLFPFYQTWQEGIYGWFARVKNYVDMGITDYERFAFYYDLGIFSPTPAQLQNPPAEIANYVAALEDGVAALRAANGGNGSGGSNTGIQIPGGAWATPAARRDAQKLGLFNCGDTHTLVGAAMTLALHLTFNACSGGEWCGLFNRWDGTIPDPPAEIDSGTGVVQCVSFVKSVYRMATGKEVPFAHNAVDWWSDYKNVAGFKEYPVADGPPQPGDFIVYENVDSNGNPTGGAGHIAVVVGVQLPQSGQDGFIIIAQGNATNVLAEQSLSQRGTIWYLGRYDPLEVALGYIRVTSQ